MTACSPGIPYRHYDYLLKFLLVGDSDVGKDEILSLLDDEEVESSFCNLQAIAPKTTTILLEGKRVKLQLWDASGQGRFSTIIRSYSRGAQGVLVVYDITNRWSFDGIGRWLKEVDEQAPGVPKILIGNRLHLEFGRRVTRQDAEYFASKKNMEYFEVSPLASFNIRESLTELSRLVLSRNGMERLWKNNKVLSLQETCCRCVVRHLGGTVHGVDRLPIPVPLQLQIRSFADSAQLTAANTISTLRRQQPGGVGRGFLLQHKRSGSDVSGGRRSLNGSSICGGGGNNNNNNGAGTYLTIPNGNCNLQGRLSNGYNHHQRSISAVMTPLWNKLHRNHHSSSAGVTAATLSGRRSTMPASTTAAVSSSTTTNQPPSSSTSTSTTAADNRENGGGDGEQASSSTRENGRRGPGKENCSIM